MLSTTPLRILKIPKYIYVNDYQLLRQPTSIKIECSCISNMDVDDSEVSPYYKHLGLYKRIPFKGKQCPSVRCHNVFKYKRKSRCNICGVNAANAYFDPCYHGGLCILCALGHDYCHFCSRSFDAISRISVRMCDILDQRMYVYQPCGHLDANKLETCRYCKELSSFIDLITFY